MKPPNPRHWESHGPPPAEPPTHTCDCGHCNAVATGVRFSPGHGWLAVCGECAKKTEEK
jgi:hypothetical protein